MAAKAAGHVVSGLVTDCARHPMPGVVVKVGSRSVRTNAMGRYRAPAGAGSVRIVVFAGGGTAAARVTVP